MFVLEKALTRHDPKVKSIKKGALEEPFFLQDSGVSWIYKMGALEQAVHEIGGVLGLALTEILSSEFLFT